MLLYYLKETKVFNKKIKIFNMLIFWSEGNENTTFFISEENVCTIITTQLLIVQWHMLN